MRQFCAFALVCAIGTAPVRADDPLRLIPAEAQLAIKVEKPRQLVESLLALDVLKQLEKVDAFQDLVGSSNSRQFYQLVSYFEKELGAPWPQLVDRLAGDGIVLAVKYGSQPQPALMVIQAKDEALLKKFVELGLQVIEQELARQDVKARPEKGSYRGLETIKIGNEFHAAVVGPALLIANKEAVLHAGLQMHLDKSKRSVLSLASLAEAKKPDALAWAWLDMEAVRQLPAAKEFFDIATADPNVTLLFGSYVDLLRRASFVAAELTGDQNGFTASIRIPAGTEGSGPALSPFITPAGQPAALPLLEPKGVMLSTSYFWDVSKYWTERGKLYNDQQRQILEQFDKQSGLFLAGSSVSQLLTQAGPYQRFVVAHQDKMPYTKLPAQRLPAFGLVLSMRDPKFGKSMETMIRAGALFTTTQLALKMNEEQHQGVKLVAYRFPEDGKVEGDTTNIRFNFHPCFAAVGEQFLIASTVELGKELIDLLQQEQKKPGQPGPASERTVLYSAGAADLLHALEDQILAQTMLDRALSPAEAKQQVQVLFDLVRKLGTFELASRYGAREFRYDIRFKPGK